jgi:hypothetical protein
MSNLINGLSRASPQRRAFTGAPNLYPHCTQHGNHALQTRQTQYTKKKSYSDSIRFY